MSFSEFSKQIKPELRPISIELYTAITQQFPQLTGKPAWSGYGFKQDSDYSCLIVEYRDHLQVMIMRGIMLDDPAGVLEGRGVNTRHIKYRSVEDVTRRSPVPFIKQQLKLYEEGLRWE
jgi:hypothetical protein